MTSEQKKSAQKDVSPGMVVESFLILAGIVLVFSGERLVFGDGLERFNALEGLLSEGKLPDSAAMKYSMIGPLFSLSARVFGVGYHFWNALLTVLFSIVFAAVFSVTISREAGRRFSIALLSASMFTFHSRSCYGEVFTALFAGLGLVFVAWSWNMGWSASGNIAEMPHRRRCAVSTIGWLLAAVGVSNTVATLPALFSVSAYAYYKKRKLAVFLPSLLSILIFLLENLVRNDWSFSTGYSGTRGFKTLLPYSGLPDFSYPFLLGVYSIIFSSGKGLMLFSPGLLLLFCTRFLKYPQPGIGIDSGSRTGSMVSSVAVNVAVIGAENKPSVSKGGLAWHRGTPFVRDVTVLWLIFLGTLVLVYAKWWSWYGGWFWGPRFFLFASLPACLGIMLVSSRLPQQLTPASLSGLSRPVLICVIGVLALSAWVGINGALFAANFGSSGLEEVCISNKYLFEPFCWYVPEFSPLWFPFISIKPIGRLEYLWICYGAVSFFVLAWPAFKRLFRK